MPSTSQTPQKLFEWALACKRGESKSCPVNVKKLADSMTEEELEKYASSKHDKLPVRIEEDVLECLESMEKDSMVILEKQTYSNTEDVKTNTPLDKNPSVPSGYQKASGKREPITPSLFKMPMSNKQKHERRIMDFNDFLERINYKTHDDTIQKGHGQNLTGKG
jgi:hypothetical protein